MPKSREIKEKNDDFYLNKRANLNALINNLI